MILIDGHWEAVNDLHDVSRVIRDHYNNELANKLDEMIEEVEQVEKRYNDYDLARMLELEEIIGEIQNLVRYV